MIQLDKALLAWGTAEFPRRIKQELTRIGADALPLQQGLAVGNYVADTPFSVAVNSVSETWESIQVKAGIFYQSTISGCSCSDDPTPASEINEYCEVLLEINKSTAETSVLLVE